MQVRYRSEHIWLVHSQAEVLGKHMAHALGSQKYWKGQIVNITCSMFSQIYDTISDHTLIELVF